MRWQLEHNTSHFDISRFNLRTFSSVGVFWKANADIVNCFLLGSGWWKSKTAGCVSPQCKQLTSLFISNNIFENVSRTGCLSRYLIVFTTSAFKLLFLLSIYTWSGWSDLNWQPQRSRRRHLPDWYYTPLKLVGDTGFEPVSQRPKRRAKPNSANPRK